MTAQPTPPRPILPSTPLCHICNKPVPLETAKTDDSGYPVHEDCYVLKCVLKRVTDD